jgi:hypothetical protein
VDAKIFVAFHGGSEVEIFQVEGEVLCISIGKRRVPVAFDRGEVCCLGGHSVGVVNAVAAQGKSDAARVFFFGAVSRDDAEVGDFSAIGDGAAGNKEAGVGAGGHAAVGAKALE